MTENPNWLLSAAVLAGGQSRRMGADKALLEFDGDPLLKRVVGVVERVSDDVFIVGDRPAYHGFGIPVVADAFPGTGPLGGIATALQYARYPFVLVVACDMPWLNVDVLLALANEPRNYQVLAPALASERSTQGGAETLETLHAIYARSCLATIRPRLERGEYQVVGFFDDVIVRTVDEAWLRKLDPELRSVVNANNRQELAEARAFEERSGANSSRGDSAL